MKKLIPIISISATLFLFAITISPSVSASTPCSIDRVPLGGSADAGFSVSGNKITSSFEVKGQDCQMAVTLAVWESPSLSGQPIAEQKLYSHKTAVFGPGNHSLTTKLPDCYYQADLVIGSSPTAADGTANYDYQNGVIFDGGLRFYKFGGDKKCITPVTPTPDPTPTPTPTPEVESATTELPKTGIGGPLLFAILFVTILGSTVAFQNSQKKKVTRHHR